jgi:phospholipid-binding lipoprotein MlaA
MKKILFFSLLLVLSAPMHVIRAADTSEKSVDLPNDASKEDNQSPQNLVHDPLERMNRVFFVFNERLYFWVFKPAKTGYAAVVSPDIRQCFGNFVANLSSPVSLLNNLLQGRFKDAGIVLSRFLLNSTLGVYGFGDPADTAFNMNPRPADFGETLGVYGFGEGIYLFLPLFGAKNTRDAIGLFVDLNTNPTAYMGLNPPEEVSYIMWNKINSLSLVPQGKAYEDFKKITPDPYVTIRQKYSELRQKQIEKQKI